MSSEISADKKELLDRLNKEELLGLVFNLLKESYDNEGSSLEYNFNCVDGKYCFDSYDVKRVRPRYENVEKGDAHYKLIVD